jgi:hypothetical protein
MTLDQLLVEQLCQRLSGSDLDKPKRGVALGDLMIRTKDRRLTPLQPNAVQQIYLDTITPDWRGGNFSFHGIRENLLKARQFGFSTLIGALFFLDALNTPNTVTVVIADDAENTRKLFRMVRTFYEHLPPDLKPEARYANRNEYDWPEINSRYYVGTAGDKSFGRGDTINNLHCTEVAFWPNADTVMTGLLQAVPEDGNVFLETTANGLGNFFHREYTESERGNSTFTARFFGWWQHPEYAWKPKTASEAIQAERLEAKLTEQEREQEERLASAYDLSEDQISWRRRKRSEPGMRDKFAQEYPANANEAFIASGNPYFDRIKLSQRIEEIEADPAPRLDPSEFEELNLLKNLRGGTLEIFKAPLPGRNYVIGADTSEGLTGAGNHDYDSADVLDDFTWEQVAHLHGKWDTYDFGLLLAELGWFFNTALLGIERNNHGHAVINAALHGAGYPRMEAGSPNGLYLHADYDERKDVEERKPGFPTTAKSKAFALDTLATSIDQDDLLLNSLGSLGELINYVKLPGGKSGGEGQSHDDQAMSLAIAMAVMALKPRRIVSAPEVGGNSTPAANWDYR